MPTGIYERTKPVWNKGLTITDQRVANYVNASIGKRRTEKTRQKMSTRANETHRIEISKKNLADYFARGNTVWNKGKTKETDPRLQLIANNLSVVNTGKKQSEETRKKRADRLRGIAKPEWFRQILREANRGQVPWNKGLSKENSEGVLSQSIKLADIWKSPEVKSDWIKKLRKAANLKPNKTETFLMGLLDENFSGEWMYTGNGSIVIGGHIPDFSNINGKKAVIEMFGDYWHKGEDPQDKISHYAKYGYSCLVIWEHELSDKQLVINKVKGGYNGC